MKTPIVYYGGKQRMVQTILPLIPQHEIYCEAFVGGGAIFMAKEPSKTEIINDKDGMISIFYRALKHDFEKLKKRIEDTLYDRITHKYAWFVRKFPHHFSELTIAWAFFTLSSVGFSGTLNSFGCYTKGTKARTHENRKQLFTPELHKRFEGIQIENVDALELIRRRDTVNTFFYLDPPYIDTNQSHYDGYTKEHYKALLEQLSCLKGIFLLSSFPSDILDEYIKKYGWYSFEINQVKPASKNKDGTRKRKIEVLTANYPIKNPAE